MMAPTYDRVMTEADSLIDLDEVFDGIGICELNHSGDAAFCR